MYMCCIIIFHSTDFYLCILVTFKSNVSTNIGVWFCGNEHTRRPPRRSVPVPQFPRRANLPGWKGSKTHWLKHTGLEVTLGNK